MVCVVVRVFLMKNSQACDLHSPRVFFRCCDIICVTTDGGATMSSHEEHPDAHLYESDRRLFRDRIRENTTTNNNSNDDLLATHRRETEQLLYASDASLFSQGADLWLSDRLLYRTKRDFDDESLRRDVERLRTESGFVFRSASTTRSESRRGCNSSSNSGEGDGEEVAHFSECAICLAEFANGERCIKLKCKHVYHETCIVKTLEREKRECPLCRSKDL